MRNAKRSSLVFILILSIFAFALSSNTHAAIFPKLEWIQTYDSPDHKCDGGHGVTVDTVGDVYVTGDEVRAGQNENIWLRKYDMNGNTLWTETYDSPTHTSDRAYGVALDSGSTVYVTGHSSDDIWLRKYDMNGNTLWTETYDSPAHNLEVGQGVTVDAAGNVYVTGWERRYDLGQGQHPLDRNLR
jgi:outer membrane protein assembly factor BamB